MYERISAMFSALSHRVGALKISCIIIIIILYNILKFCQKLRKQSLGLWSFYNFAYRLTWNATAAFSFTGDSRVPHWKHETKHQNGKNRSILKGTVHKAGGTLEQHEMHVHDWTSGNDCAHQHIFISQMAHTQLEACEPLVGHLHHLATMQWSSFCQSLSFLLPDMLVWCSISLVLLLTKMYWQAQIIAWNPVVHICILWYCSSMFPALLTAHWKTLTFSQKSVLNCAFSVGLMNFVQIKLPQ